MCQHRVGLSSPIDNRLAEIATFAIGKEAQRFRHHLLHAEFDDVGLYLKSEEVGYH